MNADLILVGFFSRSRALCLLLFMGLFVLPHPSLVAQARLRLGSTVEFSSVGLKMRLPRDASPKPLSSLTTHTLNFIRGGEKGQIATHSLNDLWERDQWVGRFSGPGFEVSVYNMTLPVPSGVEALHRQGGISYVLQEPYDAWKSKLPEKKLDDDQIAGWVGHLLGKELKSPLEQTERNFIKAATGRQVIVEQSGVQHFCYVVMPSKYPDNTFLVHFAFSDVDSPEKVVGQCMGSMAFSQPPKKKEDKSIALTTRKVNKNTTPEYAASKERVIGSIQNLKDWWYLETDNFLLVANIKNKKTVRELNDGLERSRGVFEQFYPVLKPLSAVSVAKAFQERQEYVAYVGPEAEWTGGLWMSSKKELVVSPIDWGSVRDRRKMMVDVIHHEAFHQYIYFATGEQQTAVWFNEGNATFFEGLDFKGSRPVIEETDRAETMQKISQAINIPAMLQMDYAQFYGGNREQNYTGAYGLIYFMYKGAPVMEEPNTYSEIPRKYYDAIIELRDSRKATEAAFEGVDMDKFVADFREFWSNKSLVKRSTRHDPFKDLGKK